MSRGVEAVLTSPEANADPYPYLDSLRRTDPIYWDEEADAWIVTSHSAVVAVTRRHELFSSAIAKGTPRDTSWPDRHSRRELDPEFREFSGDMLIQHDRPTHLKMRQIVHRWFTPRAVERWRSEVRAAVGELVARRLPAGHMEVRDDFATPLPLMVVCRMLDVPLADGPMLRNLAEQLNRSVEPGAPAAGHGGLDGFAEYFGPLIESRFDDPGEDLISMLAAAEREGVLGRREVLANVILLMDAGHETTLNLICNGILAFIRHHEEWDRLRDAPEVLCASATEECLRFDPPFKGFWRICRAHTELGGKVLRRGQLVFWSIAAANRDPAVFTDPDRFDITRSPNPHVAFGGGIHHCLGAALARLEGQEVFKALAGRFPRMELTGSGVEYLPNVHNRSVKSLEVRWS